MCLRIAAALFIAVGPALLACGDDAGTGPGPAPSIAGTVTLLESGDPVRGATILLVDVQTLAPSPATGRTDDSGHYSIAGVAPGEYLVLVHTDVFSIHDRSEPTVRVEEKRTAIFDMRLAPTALWPDTSRYRIEGTVIDEITSDPLPGAYVSGFSPLAGSRLAGARRWQRGHLDRVCTPAYGGGIRRDRRVRGPGELHGSSDSKHHRSGAHQPVT